MGITDSQVNPVSAYGTPCPMLAQASLRFSRASSACWLPSGCSQVQLPLLTLDRPDYTPPHLFPSWERAKLQIAGDSEKHVIAIRGFLVRWQISTLGEGRSRSLVP